MKDSKVIAYASIHLKMDKNNNFTHDLELDVMVLVLKHWRQYSYGVLVEVFFDHKSFSMFLNRENSTFIREDG